jgi:transcriptional regulator with XRE-family HTH domain
MNNGNTARRHQTQDRDREIWRLRIEEGLTQAQIAERVGLAQPVVSKALRRISRQLAGEFHEHAEEILLKHTDRLERVYREAMAEWARSREDQETEATEEQHGIVKTTKTRRNRVADAALLGQATSALLHIRRLWGVEPGNGNPPLIRPAPPDDEEGADGA